MLMILKTPAKQGEENEREGMTMFEIIWIIAGVCLLAWWLFRRFRK